MINWLKRLFSGGSAATPAAAAVTKDAPSSGGRDVASRAAKPGRDARARSPEAVTADTAELAPLLPWLLGCGPLVAGDLTAAEKDGLATLDKALALPALPDELLPRAAALIPQLLAMLRQSDLPMQALAQRVSKDVLLTTEVLRLARSPFYRAQGEVNDLAQAIALIGIVGLQKVIARVVLKPIFDAAPGPLSARAGARLWDYSEALAQHTSELANQAGLPSFDGYLAGLLHGSGWTVALRLLDRMGQPVALPPTAAFGTACTERAHRLFGLASRRWDITPGFTAFGADAREHALAASTLALAGSLRQAQSQALGELASPQAPLPTSTRPH